MFMKPEPKFCIIRMWHRKPMPITFYRGSVTL